MKITIIIVRSLMGLLLLFGSIAYLFNLMPQPELTGNVKIFMEGVMATGYLMLFIKLTELVCGLAFITGRFVPLAAVIIAPVTLNIFLFHYFVDPNGLPIAVGLVGANVFLGYAYWERYKPMMASR